MSVSSRSPRPRREAELAFLILMDLVENGSKLDPAALGAEFERFVTAFQLGMLGTGGWRFFQRGEDPKEVHKRLVAGFTDLARGMPFSRPPKLTIVAGKPRLEGQPLVEGVQWVPAKSFVGRLYSLDSNQFIFSQVFDLLVEVGPWLRLCRREGCGRFFLYTRSKQIYCSDKCAQRVRMARFLEQKKARISKRPPQPRRRERQARGRARKKG